MKVIGLNILLVLEGFFFPPLSIHKSRKNHMMEKADSCTLNWLTIGKPALHTHLWHFCYLTNTTSWTSGRRIEGKERWLAVWQIWVFFILRCNLLWNTQIGDEFDYPKQNEELFHHPGEFLCAPFQWIRPSPAGQTNHSLMRIIDLFCLFLGSTSMEPYCL